MLPISWFVALWLGVFVLFFGYQFLLEVVNDKKWKSIIWATASMIFHSYCFMIVSFNILLMYKLKATSLCSRGWLEENCMVTSVSVGIL